MTKVHHLICTLLGCLFAFATMAQQPFTNCSAAFLNNKIVVDEYTDQGKCVLDSSASGILTVCTANLSPEKSIPVKKIDFKIALKDRNTGTLTMYSDKTFQQVEIRSVLKKCRRGDRIVLITMNDEYSLPHHEILVR